MGASWRTSGFRFLIKSRSPNFSTRFAYYIQKTIRFCSQAPMGITAKSIEAGGPNGVILGSLSGSWPRGPRGCQDGPRGCQDGPRQGQDRAKMVQDRPKTAQDSPKTPQDMLKTSLRWSMTGPRQAQDPKMIPKCFQIVESGPKIVRNGPKLL